MMNGSNPHHHGHPSSPDHTVHVQQLFVKNQSRLKAFILALQPNFTEAEDILQEVFLLVTRKAERFTPGTNFMAWALSICRLKVLESFRQRKTAASPLSEEVMDTLCSEPPMDLFEETRWAAVRVCLDRLAPNMQEVMRLRYFADHGPSEIARRLSWSSNSVNVTLSKARKLMHDCVGRRLQEA